MQRRTFLNHLAIARDGVLRLRDAAFANGNIEFEGKGENVPGQSFLGNGSQGWFRNLGFIPTD